MGLMAAFFMSGMLVLGLYKFIFRPDERTKLLAEMQHEPIQWIGLAISAVFFIMFFWGILIPPFGFLRVSIVRAHLQVWQLGGIGFFACALIYLIYDEFRLRSPKKRRSTVEHIKPETLPVEEAEAKEPEFAFPEDTRLTKGLTALGGGLIGLQDARERE